MKKKLFINSDMEIKASKEDNRTVEFIASKEVVDRGGDVVKIKGISIKDYKNNPVIMFGHKHSDLPIGKAVSTRKVGDELRMKIQFAKEEEYPFADTVYKLVKGGYIKATSIGIIPDYDSMEYPEKKKLNGKSIRRIINKSELFELSIVPIPMNQDALATGKTLSKAIEDGIINDDELKEYNEMTREEQIKEEPVVDEPIEYKEENIELKAKVAELELQIKEQEMEEEEEDSIYKKMYDEFSNDKVKELDTIKELYEIFMDKVDEDKDSKILDKYFK